MEFRFLEPLDILLFRGNRLFGDPGSLGESMIPPWPSQVAGALRSRLLVEAGVDLNGFASGRITHPALGSPETPGPFTLALCCVARRFADGRAELVVPPPADAVITEREESGEGPRPKVAVRLMRPQRLKDLPRSLACSYLSELDHVPVLAQAKPTKPREGWWFTEIGWRKYLSGQRPDQPEDLIETRQLWEMDTRVGVGLSRETRAAAEGRLFSNRAVAMRKREHQREPGQSFDAGFLVAVLGAPSGSLRPGAMLRLGGDNRAAVLHAAPDYELPRADYGRICADKRCRLVLASPGIFEQGWLPDGCRREGDSIVFELHGVEARLAAAAVPRSQVISGWDLARWLPKAARRAVPAGSVYWLVDLKATPEDLERLVRFGLWTQPEAPEPRRAEGFNRIWLARWPED
jgi:CRISPR-associated protein Cmr3